MDYLINEQEDKARALLHQIFIEKARAINEDLMSEDDEVIGGDEGLGLGHEIEHDKDEIESEEHYGDGTMEDVDVDDSVDDLSDDLEDEDEGEMDDDDEFDDEDSMGGDEHEGSEEERISDLEQAIEDLKAEFEALKGEEGGSDDLDVDVDDNNDDGYGDDVDVDVDGDDVDVDLDDHEEEVDENWMDETNDLDEDWDDLEESLDLETIAVNAKKAAEVGSGKFARPEANTRSAVAPNAPNMNGAKPVVLGRGKAQSGYERQTAPTSNAMKLGDNRRKKSTEGTSQVSKEGSTKALINKDRSEGFGAPNMKSPLGSGTTPKK
jgi:hypothetical protein